MARDTLFCRACGKRLKPDAMFCPYCGERVIAPGPPAATATPAVQSAEAAKTTSPASAAQAVVAATRPQEQPTAQAAAPRPSSVPPAQASSAAPPAQTAPGTRTRVFNPATTPARSSQRLGDSSLVTLGVWAAAIIGIVCAGAVLVAFLGSLGRAVAELSVYAPGQAALGAGCYALISLAFAYLIGGLGMGPLRRHLAKRALKPSSFIAPFIRAAVLIILIALGMLLVAPALHDPTFQHPLAGFLLGASSGAGKGLYLLFDVVWPVLGMLLPALAVEVALLLGLRYLAGHASTPGRGTPPPSASPAVTPAP